MSALPPTSTFRVPRNDALRRRPRRTRFRQLARYKGIAGGEFLVAAAGFTGSIGAAGRRARAAGARHRSALRGGALLHPPSTAEPKFLRRVAGLAVLFRRERRNTAKVEHELRHACNATRRLSSRNQLVVAQLAGVFDALRVDAEGMREAPEISRIPLDRTDKELVLRGGKFLVGPPCALRGLGEGDIVTVVSSHRLAHGVSKKPIEFPLDRLQFLAAESRSGKERTDCRRVSADTALCSCRM